MGDFYEKTHFRMKNFSFLGGRRVWIKNFGPKYQKAHPYAKTSWINRFAYMPVAVFLRYMVPTKNHARTAIGNSIRRRYHAAMIVH